MGFAGVISKGGVTSQISNALKRQPNDPKVNGHSFVLERATRQEHEW